MKVKNESWRDRWELQDETAAAAMPNAACYMTSIQPGGQKLHLRPLADE